MLCLKKITELFVQVVLKQLVGDVTDYYLIGSKEDVVETAQQNCSHRKYGGGQPNKFSFEYVALCLAIAQRGKSIFEFAFNFLTIIVFNF